MNTRPSGLALWTASGVRGACVFPAPVPRGAKGERHGAMRPWGGKGRAEAAEKVEEKVQTHEAVGAMGHGTNEARSAMGREGRRGREPYGAPWSGKGGGGGAGRAEGRKGRKGRRGGEGGEGGHALGRVPR